MDEELWWLGEEGGGSGGLADQVAPTRLVADILYAVALVSREQRLLPVEGREAGGVGRLMFGG